MNKIIEDMIKDQLLIDDINEMDLKNKDIKSRDIKINKSPNKIGEKEIIKTPLYFYRHYPLNSNY